MPKHATWPLFLLLFLSACTPPAKQVLSANAILPSPPPRSPISDWTCIPTRLTAVQTVPGAALRGWTFRALPNATQPIHLLFFNGNAMTIDGAQTFYRALAVRGSDVTVFDYRGYGFSTGTADVMAFRRDALALYDSLASTGPTVVYGFSMGTAMATYVASERPVAGLILAGSIASAADEFPIFAHALGMSPAAIANSSPDEDATTAFDEEKLITRSSAPLLMIHGEADSLVPIQQGRAIFAASLSPRKRFVPVPGAAHNETIESPTALQAVRDFLGSIQVAPATHK